MLARKVNVRTIIITTNNIRELSTILTVLRFSKVKHKVRINRINKTTDIYVKINDEMDLAIIKAMNIDIIDNAKAQEISKHCLMVAEEFKKNPLLRAIASYS